MEKETAIKIVRSMIHCVHAEDCKKCPSYVIGDFIEEDNRGDITNVSCSERSSKNQEQIEDAAKALLEELGIYKEVCKKEKKLLGIKEN